MAFRSKEVDDSGRNDDSDRQNYIRNDMDVGCLYVYIVVEFILHLLALLLSFYLLVRCRTICCCSKFVI